MAYIQISNIYGTLPFQVYFCDSNVNNCQLVQTITDPVYWPVNIDLPISLSGVTTLFVKIIDTNQCETFELISCN
jgi:hypothetical protein